MLFLFTNTEQVSCRAAWCTDGNISLGNISVAEDL